MEICPNCENQIADDQIVCSVCGMILKDIRVYSKFFKIFLISCLVIVIISIFVNLLAQLLILL